MKNIICLGLFGIMSGTVSAELLLSWDGTGSLTPSNDTLNISGEFFGGLNTDPARGSSDGWFGPDSLASGGISGAPITASGYKIAASGANLGFQIRNNSGQDLELTSFLFDYQSIWGDGPQKIEVYYGYGALTGVADNTLLHTFDAPGLSGAEGAVDYLDFTLDLKSVLADYVLGDGQAATFQIKGIDATASTSNGIIDNIAFNGALIPEPATISLVLLSTFGALALRHRRWLR